MIVVLILAWGSTFAAVKIGLRHSPPVLFGGIRSVVGGLVVLAIAVRLGRVARVRQHARWYLLLTLWNVIGMFGLQVLAIEKLPSGLAAVLIYLQPVLTGVLAGPLLGEHVGRTALVGLLVGFAGIAAVGVGALDGHVSVVGVGYALGTALAWSLGTITVKRAPVDLWWAVALPFTVGGVVLCALSLAFEGGSISWTPSFVAALAYSTLVGTSLSWGLWFALVAAGEATRAAAVIFFVPLVSLVIGVVVLHETLHASLVVGAALVVVGVWLVNRRPSPPDDVSARIQAHPRATSSPR
jgi:drug/metabolite transporter (DMT)-like permease